MVSLLHPEANNVNDDSIFQFDVERGSCYVYCWFSLISSCAFSPCYCIARKLVSSQQVRFVEDKINYRSDCWLLRQDKMVPLDRVQDVNISENCCHRCWGVTDISIQTAGGGEMPEIVITAVKNPHRVRDEILSRRDRVAQLSNGTDGFQQRPQSASPTFSSGEVKQLNETMVRIEKLLERTVEEKHKADGSPQREKETQLEDVAPSL